MIKLLSLFSGIGAFEKALKNLNIEYELVGFSEINKYAVKSYCMIHDVAPENNLGDITKIDISSLPEIDLITYGFPCQDISIAGDMEGIVKGKTRSGLVYNAIEIIKSKQPKYAIAENVKNLLSSRMKNQFEDVLHELDLAGYNSYYQLLNAQDYGIPQSRERVFIVSIRKDIDKGYSFPEPKKLDKTIMNFLQGNVENKYYIQDSVVSKYTGIEDISETMGVKAYYKDLRPTYISGTIDSNYWKGLDNHQQRTGIVTVDRVSLYKRIRRLTPKECYLLMGFTDDDYNKIKGISDTQLYKQAGNSIVVSVAQGVLECLLVSQ